MKLLVELTESQADTIVRALSAYAKLHTGRIKDVVLELAALYPQAKEQDIQDLYSAEPLALTDGKVHPIASRAIDIVEAVRNAKHPELLPRHYSQEPLPLCKIIP